MTQPAAQSGSRTFDTAVGVAARALPTGWRALAETTKPRITRLVTITTGAGFVLTAATRGLPAEAWPKIGLPCVVGTALCAGGANAINQWMERERDALMDRTRERPIPGGRARPGSVLAFGVMLSVIGLVILGAACGVPAMLVSLACIVSYVAVYTPLKPVTPLATFIGAIPGALPPLIGSLAAARGAGWAGISDPAGVAIFLLMTVWQIPHFLAIAWLYREDYAKGGYAVLPVIDPRGGTTAWTVALWAAALLPTSLLPVFTMRTHVGLPYGVVAGLSCGLFAVLCGMLVQAPTRTNARRVFFASIAHLPLLLGALCGEVLIRAWWPE